MDKGNTMKCVECDEPITGHALKLKSKVCGDCQEKLDNSITWTVSLSNRWYTNSKK